VPPWFGPSLERKERGKRRDMRVPAVVQGPRDYGLASEYVYDYGGMGRGDIYVGVGVGIGIEHPTSNAQHPTSK